VASPEKLDIVKIVKWLSYIYQATKILFACKKTNNNNYFIKLFISFSVGFLT